MDNALAVAGGMAVWDEDQWKEYEAVPNKVLLHPPLRRRFAAAGARAGFRIALAVIVALLLI